MKKKFFILLCLCTLCIGSVWGAEWTGTFPNSGSISNNSYTLNEAVWSIETTSGTGSPTISFGNAYNKPCIKFGSGKSNCYADIKLSTDYFNNSGMKITKVEVNAIGSAKKDVKLSIGSIQTTVEVASNAWTLIVIENLNVTGTLSLFFDINSAALFINQIKITYEEATPTSAYTVTFDAGTNGSCSTTELTEASAGEGVTLPECTANTGYVFKGWSTTEGGTTPDAGKAGETYKPSSDCTLYAVYNALYTVTIIEPENGTLVVKNGEFPVKSGSSVEEGTTLTIDATPSEGYKFKNWQYKEEEGNWTTKSANFKYEITSNVSFRANFEALPTYTINYMINGVNTGAQENVYEGTPLEFPTVNGFGGKVFVGWSETAINGTADVKPTLVNTTGLTATANATYYAVFANKEGEGDDKYVKVTSTPADWSGEYLLVYEYEDNSTLKAVAWTGVDAAECNVAVTISNGEITTIPEGAVTLTIAAMDGGYSIQVNGGTNDGKYINQTTYDNKITFNETPSANTLSYSSSENSTVIAGSGVDDNGNHVTMRYNNADKNYRFRYYKSGQQPVQLYLMHGATYSNYCTDISYTRTVNTANIGTLCVPYAFEKPDYMTLYNIVGKADSKIYFEENTATIEAGKPYLFRSTEGTITLTYTGEKATEAKSSNGLVGTFDGCAITPNTDNYILSNNTLYYVDSDFNCGANRAYINIDDVSDYNPSAAKSDFTLDFNDPTGITSYENDNDNENLKAMTVYNLNGMRVNGSYKGIVVVNGKKFINK